MRRDSAVTFGDLVGRLRMLRVDCAKCGRAGSYSLALLIRECGRNCTILDWKDKLTSNCARRIKADCADQCVARCPDLLKAL